MNRLNKHLLKVFVLLLALTIINCQKEDDNLNPQQQTSKQKSSTKMVSAKDVPHVIDFIKSKTNERMEITLDDSNSPEGMNRSHEDNLILTNALTEQIMQVTNSYGKSNFTFELIEEQTKTEVYFLNLVVKEYKETFYLYITKFVPDANWLNTYRSISDFSTFSGMIYYYSDQGIYLAKIDMLDGTSTSIERHPCDVENPEGTSGGESTGTGTGTGTTGGTGSGTNPPPIDPECIVTEVGPPYDCDGSPCQVVIITDCDDYDFGANQTFNDMLRHPCDPPEVCYNDAGDPCPCNASGTGCDDGGGDGDDENSEIGIISDLKTTCEKLNAKTEDQNMNNKLKSLIIASNNDNFEKGFRGVSFLGQEQPSDIVNNEDLNCTKVSIGIHQNVNTLAHSHPEGCDVFGMFTAEDVMILAQMGIIYDGDADGDASNNYNDLHVMLAYVNTVFAVTFESSEAMDNLIAILQNPKKQRKFSRRLNKNFNRQVPSGGQSANIGDLMQVLLNAFNEFDLDIGFYQADVDNNNNITGWNKKLLATNGTVTTKPCN